MLQSGTGCNSPIPARNSASTTATWAPLPGWTPAQASYVALTRQRESAEVFVARETARDARQLARQMAGGEVRAASIAWPIPREGERYDARQRRKEELVSAAWREGRADPRVANELDGFMTAVS
jgi:hypothetical protein